MLGLCKPFLRMLAVTAAQLNSCCSVLQAGISRREPDVALDDLVDHMLSTQMLAAEQNTCSASRPKSIYALSSEGCYDPRK